MTPETVRERLRVQNNGWIEVIALHEGYPGHHLQESYALRNPRKLRHETEVNRFTTWPTQAPSYIVGWLEIERVKSELQGELGPRLDEKQFVERVLDQGALPLALLGRSVRNDYGLSN